jgi:hypothetical protein
MIWDDDGFEASASNEVLKAKAHCRLKLINFYESRIKRKKKKTDVAHEASG